MMVSRNSFGLNAPYCSKAATVDDRSQHERSIETYSEMPTAEKAFLYRVQLDGQLVGWKSARQLFVADCDISRRLLCGICTVSECDLLTYCAMGRDGVENVGFATSHRYHNLCANVRRKKGDRSYTSSSFTHWLIVEGTTASGTSMVSTPPGVVRAIR